MMSNQIEYIMYLIDSAIDTKSKRHITGGILMSLSLLCTGLAITIITIKEGDVNEK